MRVLDAFAIIAFVRGEPAADEVRALVEEGGVTLTVVGVAEVLDRLVRVVGVDEEEAALDLAQLDLAEPDALTPEVAMRSGRLRARHYHRRTRAVSMADCVAAETARGGALATADPALLELCAEERIPTIVLPDSSGQRWTPPGESQPM